jgi:hypothetical protein
VVVPKIEVVLSDKEYVFLYGVINDTLASLEAFAPPKAEESAKNQLLLPLSPVYASAHAQSQSTHAPPTTAAPPSSTITLQVRVHVQSAILQLHQNQHPLAEFSINSFSVNFEDGGKEGDSELSMRVGASIENLLLVDKRTSKASSHYPYIVAPKNRDLTMLKVSFCEYLYFPPSPFVPSLVLFPFFYAAIDTCQTRNGDLVSQWI